VLKVHREAPILRMFADIAQGTIWIDLLNPTSDEKRSVERLLDVEIPDEESLSEIEASSRMRSPDLDSLTAGSGVCTPALLR
jgi:Mg2+ and Co2+ transporter CorA